ncbi:MAG: helix-turn-helix transcriptional regulator [Acidobacteriota bacterium]
MSYHRNDIGPALKAMRKARRIRQSEVAQTVGRSEPSISRIERAGSNPQMSNLLAYLEAIDASMLDLHDQLIQRRDSVGLALEQQMAQSEQRLQVDPAYRQLARDLIERFGGDEPPPGLRAMAGLLDEHDARLRAIENRLRTGSDQSGSNGSNGLSIEG